MEDRDQTSYPQTLLQVSRLSLSPTFYQPTQAAAHYSSCRCHNGRTSLCLALVDTYASALNTTFYRLFKWQLEFNKGRLHYFFINAPNRGELQLTLQLLVAIIIATFLPISFVKVR